MKRTAILLALLWAISLQAQSLQDYSLSIENSTWQSIASTGTRLNQVYYANSQQIQLPFDLEFGNHTFTQGTNIRVTGRGTLILGLYGPYSYNYTHWNDPRQEYVIIPFFMGNAEAPNQSTSRVYWLVQDDDRGGQELVVEWTGMHRASHIGESVSYQLHLHSNGDIGVLFGQVTLSSDPDTLFTFAAVAGSTTDRVLITGNWDTDSSITMANPTQLSINPLTPLMAGIPDSGLLLTYIRPLPPCPRPNDLAVEFADQDAITISWTGNGVAGAQYIVQYDTADFTPGSGWHPGMTVTDTFFSVNLLSTDQHYWFKVRSDCGADTSVWESIDAWTMCDGMTHSDLPYSYGFDSAIAPCWRKLGSLSWRSQSGSGANQVRFCNLFNGNTFAIMPPMDWVNDLQVTFKVKLGPVMVGVMDNPYDTSTFTPLQECWANNYDWYTYTVRLASYTGSGQYIAFRPWPNIYGMASCYLDDVLLETIHGCIEPVNLRAARFNATSADIAWRDFDSIGAYRIIWWTSGGTPDTVYSAVDHCTITGLQPETAYYVAVSILCDSVTVGPADTIQFTTLATCIKPVAVTVDNISGRAATVHWTEMNTVGTYRVALCRGFDTIHVDTVVGDTTMRYNDLEGDRYYIANVSQLCSGSWTEEAWETFQTVYSCAGPQGVSVDSIGQTTAQVTITDTLASGSYALVLRTGSTIDTLALNTTHCTLSALQPATNYILTAYTVCADSSFSEGVEVRFATPCSIITHADLPFAEDFDRCVDNDLTTLSPCWHYLNYAPSNHTGLYRPTSQKHYGNAGLSLYTLVLNSSQPMFLVLPEVDSLADLVIAYHALATMDGRAKIEAGVMTDPADTATFTPLNTLVLAERDRWYEQEVSLGAYSGTGRFAALRIGDTDSSFSSTVYLDDIQLKFDLSCDQPDSLYIADLTDSSATLVILPAADADSDAAAFQVVISSWRGSDTLMSASDRCALADLQPATDYTVSVRSVCPEGGLTLATAMQFTTSCGAYRLPWFDDFEHQDMFQLPRCWEVTDTASEVPQVRWVRPSSYSGENLMLVSLRDSAFSTFATPLMAPHDGPATLRFVAAMYETVGLHDTTPVNLSVELQHGTSLDMLYSVKTVFADWTPVEIAVDEGLLADGGRFVFTFTRVDDTSRGVAMLRLDDIGLTADTAVIPEGIEPITENRHITVAPNPADRWADIACDDAKGSWTLHIIDAMGREAASVKATAPRVRLDLTALPAGIYFLRASCTPTVARLMVVR